MPDDPIKAIHEEFVADDVCPMCLGELDTGWECNDCGFDAYCLVKKDDAS